ncbi:MetQ/NlpA family ABC transporter substrate-binding protein [Sulfitobacter geojensis]|uniref:MetQ/NlpA family ABC transporter substrate-binding protein n=1 Tax=Sulfitobacter geojensis TaxID=1342299 RepID=UPI00046A8FC8|nr:MetQ/NlpA family ABC transporter substrate-binding protein [Sulfitobacter geojensis]KHA51331.1 Lipoprotein [Sulfitobacter geojensis]NYI30262.1 D-methionine transport system substrate-binding protein [Sulfitobacter geojensis]
MKTLIAAALASATLVLSSGIALAQDKTIRMGFFPGPYADQFERGIRPILEEKGFAVESIEFSNAIQPNTALIDGDLDANVFQNDGWMNQFNEQYKGDLVAYLHIPSAPLGLYSNKVTSVEGIEEGMSIAVPNDPTNLGRALAFLQELDLITVKEGVEPTRATENDIADNPKNLEIVPLDAPQIMRAMADVDVAAALGNHVISSGNLLSQSFSLEKPALQYQITVVGRDANANSEWAEALVEAYKSDAFRAFVESDPKTIGFSTPDHWQ